MHKTGTKNLGLEGLRGIASLAVAIGHFTFVFFPYLGSLFRPIPGLRPAYPFESWVQYPPFSLLFSAEAAVCVFFVMSGYVLTSKYFSTGNVAALQTAASKRYIRLVLPSFASVMFAWVLWRSGAIITQESAAIGVAGWVPAWYVGPFPFLGSVFNGFIGAPLLSHTVLNPPLWTIQVELIGSILLFSMFAVFGRNPVWLCAWFLFFSCLLGYFRPNSLFYLSFFVGALMNPAREWLRSHQSVSALLVALGLIGVAFNHLYVFSVIQAIHLPNFQPYGPNLNDDPRLFWNTVGAICLVAGVIGSRSVGALFATRIPVFLGKVSFSIYVIHIPILMSVGLRAARFAQQSGLSYSASVAFSLVVYLTVVLAVGTLFQRYIDKPSIRLADMVANRVWFKKKITMESSSVAWP